MILEVVCSTLDDAVTAETGGAHRIELCEALQLGGLTPSEALSRRVKVGCGLPIMTMLRPDNGTYQYSESRWQEIIGAANLLADYSDGFVIGCLNEAKEIDEKRLAKLVSFYPDHQWVCHRSFDETVDPIRAINSLIGLGFKRILTSGHAPSVDLGRDTLRELQMEFGHQIEIMPGGGVKAESARQLAEYTGVKSLHTSGRGSPTGPVSPAIVNAFVKNLAI